MLCFRIFCFNFCNIRNFINIFYQFDQILILDKYEWDIHEISSLIHSFNIFEICVKIPRDWHQSNWVASALKLRYKVVWRLSFGLKINYIEIENSTLARAWYIFVLEFFGLFKRHLHTNTAMWISNISKLYSVKVLFAWLNFAYFILIKSIRGKRSF